MSIKNSTQKNYKTLMRTNLELEQNKTGILS